MIRSMTAFGRAKAEGTEKDITVEIRSVNSRYFDPNFRLPRDCAFLEDRLRAYVQKNAASRGKVEVSVQIERHTAAVTAVRLDETLAEGYIAALKQLQKKFRLRDDISVMKVAENRDLFTFEKPKEEDADRLWEEIRAVFDRAVAAYVAAKEAEGARTEADLRDKLSSVKRYVADVERLSKEDTATYHDRLEARLRQALDDQRVTIDEQRILTECAIFADKVAVDEEIARLNSHFETFDEILKANEPAGRKLDFLMQEMNRETNTIGSKCNNAAIARTVVNMKCELEKIREQIQNIE